jgi:hypothetical protein
MNPLDLILDKTFPFPPGHELCDERAVIDAMETYAKALAVEFAEWMAHAPTIFRYHDPTCEEQFCWLDTEADVETTGEIIFDHFMRMRKITEL